jgi:hypothetical protein
MEEPVSLLEAKLHLRVDFDDDDVLITTLIGAARQAAETMTGRQFVTARWQYVIDCFLGSSLACASLGEIFSLPAHAILLPKSPLHRSLVSSIWICPVYRRPCQWRITSLIPVVNQQG